MFKFMLLIFVVILFCFSISSASFMDVKMSTLSNPGVPVNSVEVGTPFTLDIYMNNSHGFIQGVSFPFTFFSPNGITEYTHYDVNGYSPDGFTDESITTYNNWDSYWNMLELYTGISWDGIDADTMNFTGVTLIGWDATGTLVHHMSFAFLIDQPGTFCIDSCSVPESIPLGLYDWQSSDPNFEFRGPYCFEIVASTNVVEQIPDDLPDRFSLEQNYPNPFNPTTKIEFSLASQSYVSIKIYNLLGQEIKSLIKTTKDAGSYTIEWDGSDNNGKEVSSAIYLYRIETDNFVDTKKMMLIK